MRNWNLQEYSLVTGNEHGFYSTYEELKQGDFPYHVDF